MALGAVAVRVKTGFDERGKSKEGEGDFGLLVNSTPPVERKTRVNIKIARHKQSKARKSQANGTATKICCLFTCVPKTLAVIRVSNNPLPYAFPRLDGRF